MEWIFYVSFLIVELYVNGIGKWLFIFVLNLFIDILVISVKLLGGVFF